MEQDRDGRGLRDDLVDAVRRRLVGPLYGLREELAERPHKRYLCGMLFPRNSVASVSLADEESYESIDPTLEHDEPTNESPTDLLFQQLPASVGLSFAIHLDETRIRVECSGASYAHVEKAPRASADAAGAAAPRKWQRYALTGEEDSESIDFDPGMREHQVQNVLNGRANIHLHVRTVEGARVATVTMVNAREKEEREALNVEDVIFQAGLRCTPEKGVPAYPEPPRLSEDPEAQELALQYRDSPSYAVGHGCGTGWDQPCDAEVAWVETDFLPSLEVPPVTAEVDGLPPETSAALSLQRLQAREFDPFPGLAGLCGAYEAWSNTLAKVGVPDHLCGARDRILDRISQTIGRIQEGIELLRSDVQALRNFRLANRALLLALARTSAARERVRSGSFDSPFRDMDPDRQDLTYFRWRPFQLAFVLISLPGLNDPAHPDRKIVDLIWFPTGGGKTEAYLAVAAFEMIRRRIVAGGHDPGTAVIKRYTLRLLTIQQFERAGALVCALETMRQKREIPGERPFSLGLWVGAASSPNTRKDALKQLEALAESSSTPEGVGVPLKRCPVCGTGIVPEGRTSEDAEHLGIRRKDSGIQLFCPDTSCPGHRSGLPISYVDEDLYDEPPSLLLATVDKFANLAWDHRPRVFFGSDRQGSIPPSLIIQDELHLISGPLGTITGVYEAALDTVIQRQGIPAKYICATATIRRAEEQVKKLYGRECAVFPPRGIEASDSFFSRTSASEPGRLYVGAMGQGHTPTFSNVLASAALLDAVANLREAAGEAVDTWWTLVSYQNSKRELGKTLTLARDDIPARLQALGSPRNIREDNVRELSANLRDSEIPEMLSRLAVELPDKRTLDFVACTNMLSVGVDVSRLGLMIVNGQPKTVSEYIQASSRVGRDACRPPGLVMALMSSTKPRDRSHYESFRPFHGAFYRHVEPTSVTPFAVAARERALHGAFLALLRMASPVQLDEHASRVLEENETIVALRDKLIERIAVAEPNEADGALERLDEFIGDWIRKANDRGRNLRIYSRSKTHASVIKDFGTSGEGWPTLRSFRHVDTAVTVEPVASDFGGTRT